jgi:N6-L-threonylcarbamoyladenine synthase
MTLILGIDTSCDDTSAAIVDNGTAILSNCVSSQHDIHRKYGGIVPELASRKHIEMIWPTVQEALDIAQTSLNGLSAVAVCHGPGLIGSLLVGVAFAKSLAYAQNIPLIAVNHLEGHLLSPFLDERHGLDFPFLALIVSGGHTHLYRVNGFGAYVELGRTRDDAAGEAFDKVAKILALPYPGGPAVDSAAAIGNPFAIPFPRPYLPDSLDFSFSGLKTAVLIYTKTHKAINQNDVAASFQEAVIDVIAKKILSAARLENLNKVVLSGGVAANNRLRTVLKEVEKKEGLQVVLPPKNLCTDNAAMIALAGWHRFMRNQTADLDLNPKAYLAL